MGKTVACLVLESPLVDGMLTRNGYQVTVRQPYRCCYVFILAYGRIFLVYLNIHEILKNTFEKSYTSNYSQEIFIIDNIKTSNVHYYFLKDLQGEKIDGSFYEQELLKTKQNDLYIIEKIIKKVGNKYLVKWKNYSDKFNSYVNQNDIVKYL